MTAALDSFWRIARRGGIESSPERLEHAALLVRLFYGAYMCEYFWWSTTAVEMARVPYQPRLSLWITSWVSPETFPWIMAAAMGGILGGALLAMLRPDLRWVRVAFFVGLVVFLGFRFSAQGKIDHSSHAMMLTSFAFLFLPSLSRARAIPRVQRLYLDIFWLAQLLVLSQYTTAGVSKLLGGVIDASMGQAHLFQRDALPLILAENWSRSESTLLGAFLVHNPGLAQLGFLGVVYLETFSLVAAFRGSLHRVWGLGLLAVHLGILHSMNIPFVGASITLVVLFVGSPFVPATTSPRLLLAELPLIGGVLSRTITRMRLATGRSPGVDA